MTHARQLSKVEKSAARIEKEIESILKIREDAVRKGTDEGILLRDELDRARFNLARAVDALKFAAGQM